MSFDAKGSSRSARSPLHQKMTTIIGEPGPKNVIPVDRPSRHRIRVSTESEIDISIEAATPTSGPGSAVRSSPRVFGVAGPTNVEVLEHPTRHQTRLVGNVPASMISEDSPGAAAFADSLTPASEASTMGVLPSGGGRGNATFGATSFLLGGQRSTSNIGEQPDKYMEWSRREMTSGHRANLTGMISASERFAQPMASEGEGSVFPSEVTLTERREYEVEIIQRFDRLEINKHVGDFWFLIDAIWMNRWINFVLGRDDPPGPITNYNLYDRVGDEVSQSRRESLLVAHAANARSRGGVMANRPDLNLRNGMQKVRDYRAIHPLVWYIFREIYATDGSPEVCRWTTDIYTPDVTATRKMRLETETHTKAVYELRRFVARIKEECGKKMMAENASKGNDNKRRAHVFPPVPE